MGRINDPETGGTVDYYGIPVKHPRRQTEPCLVDVDDLSAALRLTPEEFNIMKAIVRSANARKGNGKPGYDDMDARIRDAKKMVHYSNCNLKILEDGRHDLVKSEPSVHTKTPNPVPVNPNDVMEDDIDPEDPVGDWLNNTGRVPYAEKVQVRLKDGTQIVDHPKNFNWRVGTRVNSIMSYQIIE